MNITDNNDRDPLMPDPALCRPESQVTQPTARRRLSAAYKLRILAEADACTKPGDLGQLLRREGLYASSLASFRKQRDLGKLRVETEKARKRRLEKAAVRQRVRRKLARLEAEHKKLKLLLDLQKKVAALMNLPLDFPTDT